MQVYLFTPSWQVPPFWHGLDEHSLMLEQTAVVADNVPNEHDRVNEPDDK